MGEKPDQIERHIYEKRNELGENIHELQQKVKTAVDWRAQFDQRPLAMVGIAFGGGLLLSMLIGRGRNSHDSSSRRSRSRHWKRESQRSEYGSSPERQQWKEKGTTAWDNIRDAVIAIAGSKLSSLIEKVAPGFTEQYKRRQTERRSPSPHNGPESVWRRRTASGETDYSPQS
jgi:hypothetical protein